MKPPTVHKYAGDDPTATLTACGLHVYDRMVHRIGRLVNGQPTYRYVASNLAVTADVRRTTCGNCNQINQDTAMSGPDITAPPNALTEARKAILAAGPPSDFLNLDTWEGKPIYVYISYGKDGTPEESLWGDVDDELGVWTSWTEAVDAVLSVPAVAEPLAERTHLVALRDAVLTEPTACSHTRDLLARLRAIAEGTSR